MDQETKFEEQGVRVGTRGQRIRFESTGTVEEILQEVKRRGLRLASIEGRRGYRRVFRRQTLLPSGKVAYETVQERLPPAPLTVTCWGAA